MDSFLKILQTTGFANIQIGNIIMIFIGLIAIYFAITKSTNRSCFCRLGSV